MSKDIQYKYVGLSQTGRVLASSYFHYFNEARVLLFQTSTTFPKVLVHTEAKIMDTA